MRQNEFETALKPQWPKVYNRTEGIVEEFERRFTQKQEDDVLIQLFFPPWMTRTRAQLAFITLAGQLNVDHAKAIHQLGVSDCGRLLIPKDLKAELLNKLDQIGINGYTLELGDSTVETLSADILNSAVSNS
jgi:hypothetical protein